MRIFFINIFFILSAIFGEKTPPERNIIIEAVFTSGSIDTKILHWTPLNFIGYDPKWKIQHAITIGNSVKWKFSSGNEVLILEPGLTRFNFMAILEPGDSIHLEIDKKSIKYSGRGSEKFDFLTKVNEAFNRVPEMDAKMTKPPETISEFFMWNDYFNRKAVVLNDFVNSYSTRFSKLSMNYLSMPISRQLEYYRLYKFLLMCKPDRANSISDQNLCEVYDTVINNSSAKLLLDFPQNISQQRYLYEFTKLSVYRDLGFKRSSIDSLNQTLYRKVQFFEKAKKFLKGENFENYMAYFLTKEAIKGGSIEGPIEEILNIYYASPGFPEHKEYVRSYETTVLNRNLTRGAYVPNISFSDSLNRSYLLREMVKQPTILYFWNRQCKDCEEMLPILKRVSRQYASIKGLNFISVSTDQNKQDWLATIKRNSIEGKDVYNFYSGDTANRQRTIKGLGIKKYPAIFVIDTAGKFVEYPVQSPLNDNGIQLAELVSHQLALLNDGPYVSYEADDIIVDYFVKDSHSRGQYKAGSLKELTSGTDLLEKHFSFPIKRQYSVEPSEFKQPERLLALSDIEGNFDAFRKLLMRNGVIDENFNWTFGKGHLVFAGDMFDRGDQVTECLWLIYALEDKAKAKGGYVHFILGNHEIMNLSGDIRYVRNKYLKNAKLADLHYNDFFNEATELGRWLRTKNVIEKVGNLLFAHGGISPEVNALSLFLPQINALIKPYYSNSNGALTNTNPVLKMLYSTYSSPFWYRHYYKDDHFSKTNNKLVYKATATQLDSTMRKFGIKHIVTGHTVISDTISVLYGGKVINTDTKHAVGKSEALLIVGNNFYRVNAEGKRVLLFRDEEK